ncbi:MAG: hypothetical protein FJ225_13025 [Lentisphaerae bacterium]|nr:hypothetical protein [Lentisphaerota bacterium]
MISQDAMLATLRVLSARRAVDFFIVFQVIGAGEATSLKPYVGCAGPDIRKEVDQYALDCRESVLKVYRDAHNLIDDRSPYGPPNEEGQRWWVFVLATGATRSAGFAIVGRVAAIDANDLENYMREIDSVLLSSTSAVLENITPPGSGWEFRGQDTEFEL